MDGNIVGITMFEDGKPMVQYIGSDVDQVLELMDKSLRYLTMMNRLEDLLKDTAGQQEQ